MQPKGLFLGLCLALVLTLKISNGEMNEEIQDNINNGLDMVKSFLEAFDSTKIEKLVKGLGVIGGVFSFVMAFIPKRDSAELSFMKKKFIEVNYKLDIIINKFDGTQDLMKLETQKAMYAKEAFKIDHAAKKLNEFINEIQNTRCSNEKDCKRMHLKVASRFAKDFDVRQNLFTILKGATEKNSVFGDALLKLIYNTYKGDIPKITHFADSVLRLCFKAEEVVLAYEQLTGSKISIIASLKSWLDGVYKLREARDMYKIMIYNNINEHIERDVQKKEYRVNEDSNSAVVAKMRLELETKYPWTNWIVFAYNVKNKKEHSFKIHGGNFVNLPKDKDEESRRVIIAVPQGQGTFHKQRADFDKAVREVGKNLRINNYEYKTADGILKKLSRGLKEKDIWRTLSLFAVQKEFKDFKVSIHEEHTYLHWYEQDIEILYCSERLNSRGGKHECVYHEVHIIAVFKSEEEMKYTKCTKLCQNGGECIVRPYSGSMECICKPGYEGSNCESKTDLEAAQAIEGVLMEASNIPTLTDLQFNLQDLRDAIGASLGNLQTAVAVVEQALHRNSQILGQKIDKHFVWANLFTLYSDSLEKLKYITNISFADISDYRSSFAKIGLKYDALFDNRTRFVNDVLRYDALPFWLYQLNMFISGRSDEIMKHKSAVLMIMEKYRSEACKDIYFQTVENAFKQINILQAQGYIFWIEERRKLNLPTKYISNHYKAIIKKQGRLLNSRTCSLNIANSENAKCGRLFFPGMKINLQCKHNFYISGSKSTSCIRPSKCLSCNCNSYGSTSQQCGGNGQCRCKPNFYGTKCANRDCRWSRWRRWSSCTRTCGYGGYQRRYRDYATHKSGNGRSCSGGRSQKRNCFNRCCYNQFHCTRRKKCIGADRKCDYFNDCGDNEDEKRCDKSCRRLNTRYNDYGRGKSFYLDRHGVSCNSNEMLQMFQLQRSGRRIRYTYNCCPIRSMVCYSRWLTNSATKDGKGDTVYLDRQRVNCEYYGFLQYFRLYRPRRKYVSYYYKCCYAKSRWRRKIRCLNRLTSFTYDGKGRNYYLADQKVRCPRDYYISRFRLLRNKSHNKWRYSYRCCKIN